jgi:hypothetical protein
MAWRTQTLKEQLALSSEKVKRQAVFSAIYFPKTTTLVDEVPFSKFYNNGPIDYDRVVKFVEEDTELIALSFVADVKVAIGVVSKYEPELRLSLFDNVNVRRNGLLVLNIQNGNRECGRSAEIDISTLASEHKEYKIEEDKAQYGRMTFVVVFLCVLSGLAAVAITEPSPII